MCIICIKKHDKPFPSDKTLRICFENNPDGAGFMYIKDDKVVINKGYMKFKHLLKGLTDAKLLDNQTVIYHFRIATSGGETAKQCHPFPLSGKDKDLMSLSIETDIGFAHNGILDIVKPTKTLSDTMVFIKKILSGKSVRDHVFNMKSSVFKLIRTVSEGSRLVFLNHKHFVYTGSWTTDKETGLLFSNSTYENTHWYSYKAQGKNISYYDTNYITNDIPEDEDFIECPRCMEDFSYDKVNGYCYACKYCDGDELNIDYEVDKPLWLTESIG